MDGLLIINTSGSLRRSRLGQGNLDAQRRNQKLECSVRVAFSVLVHKQLIRLLCLGYDTRAARETGKIRSADIRTYLLLKVETWARRRANQQTLLLM